MSVVQAALAAGDTIADAKEKAQNDAITKRIVDWHAQAYDLLVGAGMEAGEDKEADLTARDLVTKVCLPMGAQAWPEPEEVVSRLIALAQSQAQRSQEPGPPSSH